jgi:hypothetical protein
MARAVCIASQRSIPTESGSERISGATRIACVTRIDNAIATQATRNALVDIAQGAKPPRHIPVERTLRLRERAGVLDLRREGRSYIRILIDDVAQLAGIGIDIEQLSPLLVGGDYQLPAAPTDRAHASDRRDIDSGATIVMSTLEVQDPFRAPLGSEGEAKTHPV